MNNEEFTAYALGAVGIIKGVAEVYVAPAIKELRPSTKAWLGVVAGVILYDALCPDGETLSEGYDSFIDRHPAVAWGAVALTAGHLLNVIPNPEKYDPFHRLAMLKNRGIHNAQ